MSDVVLASGAHAQDLPQQETELLPDLWHSIISVIWQSRRKENYSAIFPSVYLLFRPTTSTPELRLGRSGPYSTGAAEDQGGQAHEHQTEAGWPRVKVQTGCEPGTDAALPRALEPTR